MLARRRTDLSAHARVGPSHRSDWTDVGVPLPGSRVFRIGHVRQLPLFSDRATTKVVVLDDNLERIADIRRRLRRAAPTECSVSYVRTVDDLVGLERDELVDVVILVVDADHPTALDQLSRIRSAQLDLPIVVLHRGSDPAVGLQAVVTGAHDVLAYEDANGAQLQRTVWAAIARKQAEAVTLASANADPVTGLRSRHWMLQRLDRSVEHAREARGEWQVAVLFLDLDRFKLVNDTLGHAAGDDLLRIVADRLRAAVRAEDPVARFGGDEFVIVVEGHHIEGLAHRIALRALAAFAEPFPIEGQPFSLFASIGLAILAVDEDVETFMDRADIALYRAKRRGRNRIVAYDDDLRHWATTQQGLSEEVTAAVRDATFSLELSAVWDLRVHQRVGAIATARWSGEEPERESLVALAERNGLGPDLGRALVDRVLDLAANHVFAHGVAARWWIEMPIGLLSQPAFCDWLSERCRHHGVDAATIVLAAAEEELDDFDLVGPTLERLGDLGATVALRGFGNGRSSLTLFAAAQIDEVHLASDACRGSATDPARLTIIESLVRIAEAVGQHVVASGPLDPVDIAAVGRVGCHFAVARLSEPLDQVDLRSSSGIAEDVTPAVR